MAIARGDIRRQIGNGLTRIAGVINQHIFQYIGAIDAMGQNLRGTKRQRNGLYSPSSHGNIRFHPLNLIVILVNQPALRNHNTVVARLNRHSYV